ncbi:hypothetical protein LOAG_05637 [Loa loa]|nr:hypothetical protein LOAG_05637 [Loa loa]EFO22847.1 hypothetical protein LOAG_05637 [Loa loa]
MHGKISSYKLKHQIFWRFTVLSLEEPPYGIDWDRQNARLSHRPHHDPILLYRWKTLLLCQQLFNTIDVMRWASLQRRRGGHSSRNFYQFQPQTLSGSMRFKQS